MRKIPTNIDIVSFFQKYGLWFIIAFIVLKLIGSMIFTYKGYISVDGETYRQYEAFNERSILLFKKIR